MNLNTVEIWLDVIVVLERGGVLEAILVHPLEVVVELLEVRSIVVGNHFGVEDEGEVLMDLC
jgi:hypothetical protein